MNAAELDQKDNITAAVNENTIIKKAEEERDRVDAKMGQSVSNEDNVGGVLRKFYPGDPEKQRKEVTDANSNSTSNTNIKVDNAAVNGFNGSASVPVNENESHAGDTSGDKDDTNSADVPAASSLPNESTNGTASKEGNVQGGPQEKLEKEMAQVTVTVEKTVVRSESIHDENGIEKNPGQVRNGVDNSDNVGMHVQGSQSSAVEKGQPQLQNQAQGQVQMNGKDDGNVGSKQDQPAQNATSAPHQASASAPAPAPTHMQTASIHTDPNHPTGNIPGSSTGMVSQNGQFQSNLPVQQQMQSSDNGTFDSSNQGGNPAPNTNGNVNAPGPTPATTTASPSFMTTPGSGNGPTSGTRVVSDDSLQQTNSQGQGQVPGQMLQGQIPQQRQIQRLPWNNPNATNGMIGNGEPGTTPGNPRVVSDPSRYSDPGFHGNPSNLGNPGNPRAVSDETVASMPPQQSIEELMHRPPSPTPSYLQRHPRPQHHSQLSSTLPWASGPRREYGNLFGNHNPVGGVGVGVGVGGEAAPSYLTSRNTGAYQQSHVQSGQAPHPGQGQQGAGQPQASQYPSLRPGIVGIKEPGVHDVLFGRGGGTNFHQGNMNYRRMIKNRQKEYIQARQRSVKTAIISQIIHEVRLQNPPGRFVKHDPHTKMWYEVEEKEVKKKTSQTLREGAPQWRKANGEWKRRDEIEHPNGDSGGMMGGGPGGNMNPDMNMNPTMNGGGGLVGKDESQMQLQPMVDSQQQPMNMTGMAVQGSNKRMRESMVPTAGTSGLGANPFGGGGHGQMDPSLQSGAQSSPVPGSHGAQLVNPATVLSPSFAASAPGTGPAIAPSSAKDAAFPSSASEEDLPDSKKSRTGLDLLTDAIFLHNTDTGSSGKKGKGNAPKASPDVPPPSAPPMEMPPPPLKPQTVLAPLRPADPAEALRRWREKNQNMLDASRNRV